MSKNVSINFQCDHLKCFDWRIFNFSTYLYYLNSIIKDENKVAFARICFRIIQENH